MAEKKLFKTFSNTLDELKQNDFLSKRNILVGLVLGILVLSLPIGVRLAQQQQQLQSRAQGADVGIGDAVEDDVCTNPDKIDFRYDAKIRDGLCTGQCGKKYEYWHSICTDSEEQFIVDDESCTQGCSAVNPPPGGATPPTGQPTPPSGVGCTLSSKDPALIESCASCIAANAAGAVGFILGQPGNNVCTQGQAAAHWCNGGVGADGQSNCTNLKGGACTSQCGGTPISGIAACDLSQVNMSISPATPKVGEEVTLTVSGAQGTTWIGDSFSDATAVTESKSAEFSAGMVKKFFRFTKSINNLVWTHTWQNTAPGDQNARGPACAKTQSINVGEGETLTAPTNIRLTCNAENTQGTVTWDSLSVLFDVRVEGPVTPIGVTNNCSPHAVCINKFGAKSVTFGTTPNSNFSFWVHADSGSAIGPKSETQTFKCPAGNLTATPTGSTTPTGSATPSTTPSPTFGAKCTAETANYYDRFAVLVQVALFDKDYDCDNNARIDIIDYNIWRNRKFNLLPNT